MYSFEIIPIENGLLLRWSTRQSSDLHFKEYTKHFQTYDDVLREIAYILKVKL